MAIVRNLVGETAALFVFLLVLSLWCARVVSSLLFFVACLVLEFFLMMAILVETCCDFKNF
jgi:hypothetical protein